LVFWESNHDRRNFCGTLEGLEMTKSCHVNTRTDKFEEYQHTPLVAAGGREVVVDLEAAAKPWDIGVGYLPLDGWSYNGVTPGPIIEARQGETLVVRLTNRLDEPTTIHWHGLRLPAPMDGTQSVQPTIAPGEMFEYRFALPDAGTFWYHPHTNETVQLERGLYGVLVVRGADEPVVDRDRVLVFDDVRLNSRGEIAKPGGLIERHNGRRGKVRLLNGRVNPMLEMAAGQVERWRLVNVSSARYINFSLSGAPFQIIGSDGGLIESPVEAREVQIPPADRIEIVVGPFAEGQLLEMQSLHSDGFTSRRAATYATVSVGPARASVANIPSQLRTITPLAPADTPAMREVTLFGSPSLTRGWDFTVNGETHHHGGPVRVGELQVWDIVNKTPMDHPFHLHGFFFQVLTINGKAPQYRSWEDTVHVPPLGRVKIVWLPDDRPGSWMAHCHILEHHDAGMMMHFDVVRA
jgi:FtsP/CotA-like multicopper oxidase with cupredoxin domain